MADMLVVAFEIPPTPLRSTPSHSPSLDTCFFPLSSVCMYIYIYLEVESVVAGGHCWSTPRYIPRSYQGASTTTKGGGGGRERKNSDVLEIFSEFTQYGLAIPKIGYASYQRWSKKNNKQTKQKHTNSANFLAVPQ